MRLLPLLAAALLILVAPLGARAQSVHGSVGMSARVLAPEELRVASGAAGVKVERTRGGDTRMSVPLVFTHEVRPTIVLQQRAGDPACELVPNADRARTEAGWSTRLRCTSRPGASDGPAWARLVIVPST